MHVETRKAGKGRKYYLAHSFRQNGKVLKVRHYLGANLVGSDIDVLRPEAEAAIRVRVAANRAIRDPFRTAISPAELRQLDGLEPGRKIRVLHLSEADWSRFTEDFVYDTNAIEGSTVSRNDVAGILAKDRWPADKSRWEISETYGLADAISYIRGIRTHISSGLIRKLHWLVFRNSKEFAGDFRPTGVEVAVVDAKGDVVHRGAPSNQINALLNELVAWYVKNRKRFPPIVLAVVVHNQFETIHPFQDGNGRVGRLLLNNILIKNGMPPVNIEMKNRRLYYGALGEYQRNGNIRPSIELTLREYASMERKFRKR